MSREIPGKKLSAREAAIATARTGDEGLAHPTATLAEIKHILSTHTPSNIFLKPTGEKLARAKQALSITTALRTKGKRPRAASPPQPSKRPKLTASPANDSPTSPLPCTRCSKSTASHHHWARRHQHYRNATNPPWIQPLLWTFQYPWEKALRVREVEEWLAVVEASRTMEALDVLGGGEKSGEGVVLNCWWMGLGRR